MPPASLSTFAGDEAGADDGEEQQQAGPPAPSGERHQRHVSAMPQHGDHVVGGDDAGEPAVLVDDRERDEVVLVEERGDFVVGRVRRRRR